MTNFEVASIERRIGNVREVLQNVNSYWGKQYWNNILASLLRQANRLS
jgi:hypothetical protein